MNKSVNKLANIESYREIKENFKNIKTNKKGITLIALVVSIVVLLILSGISIQMLNGDNGLLRKTTEAQEANEKASVKEQIELQVLGSYDENAELNVTNLINNLKNIGAEVKGTSLPILVSFSDFEFTIDKDGNVENIGNGEIINATKIVALANSYDKPEDKTKYYQEIYGKTVNYEPIADIQTATAEKNVSKKAQWKVFYADENHIYLIADNYVTYDSLPKDLNSDGTTKYSFLQAYPDSTNAKYSIYKARFTTKGMDGIFQKYTGGIIDINSFSKSNVVKLLNKDFFYKSNEINGRLEENLTGMGYSNMRALASMLDTQFWDTKYKDKNGYSEYSIGAPTIEILFASYNQIFETNYGAKAFSKNFDNTPSDGYKVSRNMYADKTTSEWQYSINGMVHSWNGLYVCEFGNNNGEGYWIASPSAHMNIGIIRVNFIGTIDTYGSHYVSEGNYYHYSADYCFRPLICLKSNVILKELPEGSDYNFELSF